MRLRMLNYNIQVGMKPLGFLIICSKLGVIFYPSRTRRGNLDKNAELAKDYDIVALQEWMQEAYGQVT